MNYGGLRKSEIFHIYISDITLNPNRPQEALVRVYHPELGLAPDPDFKNRREFLLSKTSFKPRNNYSFTERLYAGWKSPLLMIYAELSGDFPLGDSRQPTYKSLRPFDLVS